MNTPRAIAILCLTLLTLAVTGNGQTTLDERLAMIPVDDLPLREPVEVYWDSHQVPFIVAANNPDLAFTLGYLHAHLRLGQIKLLAMLSQGRLSEMFGPATAKIDASLRVLNLGYASEAIYLSMDDATKEWLDLFVKGLNTYQERMASPPPEYAWLGLSPSPFTPIDILTIGRLAGADVNWGKLLPYLEQSAKDPESWPDRWETIRIQNEKGIASDALSIPASPIAMLTDLLASVSRSGSNSFAIGPSKSATGQAILVNDPHLGLFTPNFFLIAGAHTPDMHVVGMMIPGLPFFALGRNSHLAWGGTNMHAASSDLFDARGVPLGLVKEKTETIKIRFWRDRKIRTRWTPFGPIISDIPFLNRDLEIPITLKWTGHSPSNEIGAFLKANRASSPEEFSAAFADYAVSGQNIVFASQEGDIGLVPATKLPRRANRFPETLVLDPYAPQSGWSSMAAPSDFGTLLNPPEGFIASANNRPLSSDIPFGFFYGNNDRISRLKDVLSADHKWTLEDTMLLQKDTFSASSLEMAKGFCSLMEHALLQHRFAPLYWELKGWDGRYDKNSRGPVACEATLGAFRESLAEQIPDFDQTGNRDLLEIVSTFDTNNPEQARQIEAAFFAASENFQPNREWGDIHRVKLRHYLGNIPVFGRMFEYGDYPVSGSNQTLFKTSHAQTSDRHATSYGSQSRFIADMSDLDNNFFVLFGGQDGWMGSETMVDQYTMWENGDYIRIPLRPETVKASFQYHTILTPEAPKAGTGT